MGFFYLFYATMEVEAIYQRFLECSTISIDSRNIDKGCMFFALKGENFDGNRFAPEALQKGALYAVVDKQEYTGRGGYIVVDDVLDTLQKLAHRHRKQTPARVLAITGSNGKTTTKEIIHRVLSQQYACVATPKNYNNHIGVPLTLLQLTARHQYAVVEMGANHPGEIHSLCQIADPDMGIITNIGKAHLEGFGSFEGVIKTKQELYDHVCGGKGTIFYNADRKLLRELLQNKDCRKLSYGTSQHAYCQGTIIENSPFLKIRSGGLDLNTRLIGEYNFENIMAGICVGKYLEVKTWDIFRAIEQYVPENNRSQVLHKGNNEIILDAYNANPTSMRAALENFARLERKNKIVILGDMYELGSYSREEHTRIVEVLRTKEFKGAFLIGKHFYEAAGAPVKAFQHTDQFIEWLHRHPFNDCSILIKGSRGMTLEKIVDHL